MSIYAPTVLTAVAFSWAFLCPIDDHPMHWIVRVFYLTAATVMSCIAWLVWLLGVVI